MESSTIPELISFLKSSYRQPDFKAVEAMLISREISLEKKFSEEIKQLRARCETLRSDLEASRTRCADLEKEAQRRLQTYTSVTTNMRSKMADDAAVLKELLKDLQSSRARCAELELEEKRKEEINKISARNLGDACETANLKARCDSLAKEVEAFKCRCAFFENEAQKRARRSRSGKWKRRCEELEAKVFLLEEEKNLLTSGSSRKAAVVPESALEAIPIRSSGDSKGKELAIVPEPAQGVIPTRSSGDIKGKELAVVPESAPGVIAISSSDSSDSTNSEYSAGRSKMLRLA